MPHSSASAGNGSGPLLKGNSVKEDMPIPAPEFVMVPREPTQEMLRAATEYSTATAWASGLGYYRAMLKAAPSAPPPQQEPEHWKLKAAAWLRAKADAQEKTNKEYPDHVKCYPSWEKRVRDLRWDAEELEGTFGSYGAPAAAPVAQPRDSDSVHLASSPSGTVQTALSGVKTVDGGEQQ